MKYKLLNRVVPLILAGVFSLNMNAKASELQKAREQLEAKKLEMQEILNKPGGSWCEAIKKQREVNDAAGIFFSEQGHQFVINCNYLNRYKNPTTDEITAMINSKGFSGDSKTHIQWDYVYSKESQDKLKFRTVHPSKSGNAVEADWQIISFNTGTNNAGPVLRTEYEGAGGLISGEPLCYYNLHFAKGHSDWDQYSGRVIVQGLIHNKDLEEALLK